MRHYVLDNITLITKKTLYNFNLYSLYCIVSMDFKKQLDLCIKMYLVIQRDQSRSMG